MFLRVYDANGALKNTSANFSDAEIKTKYENNADTNEFSDAEQTDLATLSDNSIANALHRHSELVASDGSPDPAVSVDATGQVGIGVTPSTILHTKASAAIVTFDSSTNTSHVDIVNSTTTTRLRAVNNWFDLSIDGTIAITVENNADVEVTTGNLIIGTAGKGIDFSATADAAGMTSELFADYEEGVIDMSSGVTGATSGTYTLNANFDTLAYTKTGRVVHLQGVLTIISGSVVGNVRLDLPFVAANLTDGAGVAHGFVNIRDNGATIAGVKYGATQESSAFMFLEFIADDGIIGQITGAMMDTAFDLYVNITYIAA